MFHSFKNSGVGSSVVPEAADILHSMEDEMDLKKRQDASAGGSDETGGAEKAADSEGSSPSPSAEKNATPEKVESDKPVSCSSLTVIT